MGRNRVSYLLWYCVWLRHLTGTRIPGVRGHGRPEVCKGPWSLRGSRGYAPHGYMGLMVGYAACCTPCTRRCPLVPVQRWSIELPATTVGEWRRRRSLRRHKGGPWTVFFVVFFLVSGDLCKAGKVPTQSHGDCCGCGGHGSAPIGASRPRVTT